MMKITTMMVLFVVRIIEDYDDDGDDHCCAYDKGDDKDWPAHRLSGRDDVHCSKIDLKPFSSIFACFILVRMIVLAYI